MGYVLDTPEQINLYRAMVTRKAIGLYLKCGLIPTRGMTITKLTAIATEYTGKRYKRGQGALAYDDLTALLQLEG